MPEYPIPSRPILPPFRIDRFAAPRRERADGRGQPTLSPGQRLRTDALAQRVIWISVTVAGLTSVIVTLLVLMIDQL